ncbi:MAG TPA: 50S ribosomal protein L35 [Bacilli bacterium]|nr:50S ribosomal protein L35 [Bacilli bacterium]
MPKMKSHSASKKRFKVTGTGAVKRGQAGMSHLAPGKTQKRKRHLRKATMVTSADMGRIRQTISNLK